MAKRRTTCSEDALAAVIGQLYAAAGDDLLWSAAATGLRDLMDAVCVTSVIIDRRTGHVPHQTILYDDAPALERYGAEGIYRLDPQMRFACGIEHSRTWLDRDHLDETHQDTAEFCRWVRSNTKLGHHISAGAPVGGSGLLNALSVHKAQADGAITREDERIMSAILPHLHHASALALAHADKIDAAYWDGVLAHRHEAAALIGRDGRVLRITPAAAALLRRGEGLDIVNGRLRAAEPDDEDRLQGAIRHLGAAPPRAGAIRIRRRSGRGALALCLYPLVRAAPLCSRESVVGLMTIVDPSSQPKRHPLHRDVFGLTAREGELADMLMAGHSIESAAAALGISRNTARIHLGQVFAKTETSRQSELVRLLARI